MNKEKVVTLFKKYGYYLVAGVLIVAIGLTVVLASNNTVKQPETELKPDDGLIDVDTKPVSWTLPMNGASIIKDFSDSEIQYNLTLNEWTAHKCMDLTATDLSVFAVADGTVTSIKDDYKLGTVITIAHDNGFVTTYASLDSNVNVAESDKVTMGQKIGTASDSAETESKDGKHLHFEMTQNGKKIDPNNYLDFGK